MVPPQGIGTVPRRSRGPRIYKARDERRADIITAALAILAEQGLHACTTASLARRVGVSEADLFRHFDSKEQILAEALRFQARAVRERVKAHQGSGTAWEQLQGLVADLLTFLEETGGGPLPILSGQAGRLAPGVRRAAQATCDLVHDRIENLCALAASEAPARSHIDPSAMADLVFAIVQSIGLRWLASGRRLPLRPTGESMLQVLKQCIDPSRGKP